MYMTKKTEEGMKLVWIWYWHDDLNMRDALGYWLDTCLYSCHWLQIKLLFYALRHETLQTDSRSGGICLSELAGRDRGAIRLVARGQVIVSTFLDYHIRGIDSVYAPIL
nr:hypothetical protein Iba_chr06eCG0380 [Ipomoea batatas]